METLNPNVIGESNLIVLLTVLNPKNKCKTTINHIIVINIENDLNMNTKRFF